MPIDGKRAKRAQSSKNRGKKHERQRPPRNPSCCLGGLWALRTVTQSVSSLSSRMPQSPLELRWGCCRCSGCRQGSAHRLRRTRKRGRPATAYRDGSHTPIGSCRSGRTTSSEVLPQALEEGMPHFAFRRLRAVFDLGKQLGLHPNPLVRDPLRIGLRLADQGLQALLQIRS
jgi:hypothetical protein